MTDPTNAPLGQQATDPAAQADRVAQPQDAVRPAPVPDSIKRKMKLLESGHSSKLWRIGKNVGAAMVGAGAALLLASNPVGWGVTAVLIGAGAVAAIAGTVMTLRADFAAADIKAFLASLEGDGPIRETATLKTKLGIAALNVLESAAYAAAGFFAVAGIGAAYGASAFHGVVAASQATGDKIALPILYGVGSMVASGLGVHMDQQRSQLWPTVQYQINISEGPQEYDGDLKDGTPRGGWLSKLYRQLYVESHAQERAPVTVHGPLARHFLQTGDPNVRGHQPAGNRLPPRRSGETVRVDNRKLLELLSQQDRRRIAKRVTRWGYGIKTIPPDQPLFPNGPPRLDELAQSHRRGNCWLSSAIASALVRDGGWRKFEQILQDNGDGTVTVRLPQADVIVDKARLVTDQGYSALHAGADWARLVEKAIASYALSREMGHLKAVDGGYYIDAFRYLSHVMGPADQNAADVDQSNDAWLQTQMRRSEQSKEWQRIIEDSIANQQPVGFGSSSDHVANAMNGIPPNHVFAILGTATREGKQGYLVFNPWGTRLGPHPDRRIAQADGQATVTFDHAKRGQSPVFFIAADEAGDLFECLSFRHWGQRPPILG